MRSLFSFCYAFLLLPLGNGCTGLSAQNDVRLPAGVVAAQDQALRVPLQPRAETSATMRPTELTPDLIYEVLVGQVARQRGDYRTAFTHFLRGAHLAQDPGLVEMAAKSALTLDDAEAMRQAADAWLDLEPDSIGAHQLAAYALLETGNLSVAMDHLRRIIALAAEQGEDGYGKVARIVSKLNSPDQRMKLMEALTSEDPESAEAWFARALVAADAERQEEAVDAARRASNLRPSWSQPRILLVQLLLRHGDREQARETLETSVSENADDQGLRLLYAQFLVDEQEFSRARSVFEHMLYDTPKEPDVLFALGVLSLQLQDLEAARDYFVQLRDTGERQGDSAYYLGQVEELAENPDTAVSWYHKAQGEHALDAQVRIAQIRARQGKVQRAREILQQLRDQWPENAPTLYLIEAKILTDLGLLQEAMDVYDTALVAFPGDADLLYGRGLQALSLNRLDIMEADLKAIISEDPENADALNALGYSLADHTERFAEALSYVERALALKPNDPAILDSMGWVQFRLGKLEVALQYLRKALGLMPDGEIAAHLGEVLWTMGRRDEAWSTWDGALKRNPEHKYLLRVIGRHKSTRSDSQP
jgi:tetratricopeptide (TPR) repeat protein